MIQYICQDVVSFLASQPDNSFDLIHIDPPYQSNLHIKKNYKFCKLDLEWLKYNEEWYLNLFFHTYRTLKNSGSILIWCSDKTLQIFANIMRYKMLFEWIKTNPVPYFTKRIPNLGLEHIIWYVKDDQYIYNHEEYKKKYGEVFKGYFIQATRKHKSGHPCEKPTEILEKLVILFTSEQDLVLDLCSGSGILGKVCRDLNRRYIGVDFDQKWVEYARNSIS